MLVSIHSLWKHAVATSKLLREFSLPASFTQVPIFTSYFLDECNSQDNAIRGCAVSVVSSSLLFALNIRVAFCDALARGKRRIATPLKSYFKLICDYLPYLTTTGPIPRHSQNQVSCGLERLQAEEPATFQYRFNRRSFERPVCPKESRSTQTIDQQTSLLPRCDLRLWPRTQLRRNQMRSNCQTSRVRYQSQQEALRSVLSKCYGDRSLDGRGCLNPQRIH
jgi:hypothetical protein